VTVDWPAQPTPFEPRSRKGAATARRILLAAAELFAEHGIDRVSPSEILAASGQRNASAIQYYFGSHEGLVVATLQPRRDIRDQIDLARVRLLEQLGANGQATSLDVAVAAWVLPSTQVLDTPEGRAFIRVAAQIIRTLPLKDRVAPNHPSDAQAHAMVLEHLGHLPAAVEAERMGAAFTLMTELYANRAREISAGIASNLDAASFNAEVVSMLTGLLGAPAGNPS
jgi:AcrR family transcriptional regulator